MNVLVRPCQKILPKYKNIWVTEFFAYIFTLQYRSLTNLPRAQVVFLLNFRGCAMSLIKYLNHRQKFFASGRGLDGDRKSV